MHAPSKHALSSCHRRTFLRGAAAAVSGMLTADVFASVTETSPASADIKPLAFAQLQAGKANYWTQPSAPKSLLSSPQSQFASAYFKSHEREIDVLKVLCHIKIDKREGI